MTLPTSQKVFVRMSTQDAYADPHKASPSGTSPVKTPAAQWGLVAPPPREPRCYAECEANVPLYADPTIDK